MVAQKNFATNNLFQYAVFGFDGKYKQNTENIYALDVPCFTQKIVNEGVWFLGKIREKFKFQTYDYEGKQYMFLSLDEKCNVHAKASVDSKIVGQLFYGAPQEHWCTQGSNIYILRHGKASAEVLRINLGELFGYAQK